MSDLHDHDAALVVSAAQSFGPDLIVIAGDGLDSMSARGGRGYFSALAAKARLGLLVITGNGDSRTVLAGNDDPRIFDLGMGAVDVGNVRFVGLPDAPRTPGVLALGSHEYSEASAERRLAEGLGEHQGPIVLITHAPPRGLLDYSARFRRPVGSRAVRRFVDAFGQRLSLVIAGHVHSEGGRGLQHGPTTVWNVASAQGDPSSIGVLHVRVSVAAAGPVDAVSEFGPYLRWTAAGELSFLPWMQERVALRLAAAGLTSLRQLADASEAHVGEVIGWGPKKAAVWPARARAFVTRTPLVLSPIRLRGGSRWYLDIETDPEGGQDFVWAVSLADERAAVTQWSLTDLTGQKGMLRAVHRALCDLPDDGLYTYSGSRFDETRLEWHFKRAGLEIPRSLANAVDIHTCLVNAVALPCRSGLKDVVKAFGVEHRCLDVDGFIAASRARQHLIRGQALPKSLLRYNREDARALAKLVEVVATFAGTSEMARVRRRGLSGGAQRKRADEKHATELLAAAGLTIQELAETSPYIKSRVERGLRVTSLAIEQELSRRQAR